MSTPESVSLHPDAATLTTVRQGATEIEHLARKLLQLIAGKPWLAGTDVETYLDVIADNAEDLRGDIRAIAYKWGVVDLPEPVS